MSLSRRHFLQSLSAVAALSGFGLAITGPAELLAATLSAPVGRYVVGAENYLVSYNLATGHLAKIDIGFDMHSASPHATDADLVWALGKLGFKGALVDLRRERVLASFDVPSGMIFYGHCAHDARRNTLHAACMDITARDGHLVSYDLNTLKVTQTDRICSGPLHDTQLLPDGNLLVATIDMERINPEQEAPYDFKQAHNFWKPLGSAVTWLDGDTRKVIKRNAVADLTQAITHMHLLPTGGVIAVAAPWGDIRAGAFYHTPDVDKPLQQVRLPKKVQDKVDYEFLSVAIDTANNVAAVTNPVGALTVFIDSRTGRYLGQVSYRHFDVAYDATAKRFMAGAPGGITGFVATGQTKMIAENLKDGGGDVLNFTGAHSMIV